MTTNLTRPRLARIHERRAVQGAPLADVVRRLRAGLSGLSPTDHAFLNDLARGQYKTTWLSRLVDLAVRAETNEAAYALAEWLRAQIAARRAQHPQSIEKLIDAEDAAQHAEDDAVRQFERTKSPTDREKMREAVHHHAIALENLHAAASEMADRGDA